MSRQAAQRVFLSLMLLLVLSGLDQTILSTALPSIIDALHGRDLAPWVFSAYLLASTAVIPLYGKLADRVGTRPLLLWATGVFALGSVACALAGSMTALVAARGLQGVGGGGLMTLAMLSVAHLFPVEERGHRMGLLGAAYGLSTLVGPLVGALLLESLGWRWAFWLNLPGSALALGILARHRVDGAVPSEPHPRFDRLGALLLVAALLSLLLATRGGEAADLTGSGGHSAMPGWLPLTGLAAVLALAWLAVERRAADPLVPLGLFRVRPVAIASTLAVLTGVPLFAAVVFIPLFLQQGMAFSATRSAMVTLPLMLGITVGGQAAGRALRAGVSLRGLGRACTGLLAVGLLAAAGVLWKLPAQGATVLGWSLAGALLPAGLGLGLAFPLIAVASQRFAPPRHLGAATAMPVMLRALGGALGVALLGALLRHHMQTAAGPGLSSRGAALQALGTGVSQICLAALACVALAFLVTRGLPAKSLGTLLGSAAAAKEGGEGQVAAGIIRPHARCPDR